MANDKNPPRTREAVEKELKDAQAAKAQAEADIKSADNELNAATVEAAKQAARDKRKKAEAALGTVEKTIARHEAELQRMDKVGDGPITEQEEGSWRDRLSRSGSKVFAIMITALLVILFLVLLLASRGRGPVSETSSGTDVAPTKPATPVTPETPVALATNETAPPAWAKPLFEFKDKVTAWMDDCPSPCQKQGETPPKTAQPNLPLGSSAPALRPTALPLLAPPAVQQVMPGSINVIHSGSVKVEGLPEFIPPPVSYPSQPPALAPSAPTREELCRAAMMTGGRVSQFCDAQTLSSPVHR